jgi:alpha-L-fucosidase
MESIADGERVRSYSVEGLLLDGGWVELCNGQSVGHKRIQSFEVQTVSAVRLRIKESVGEPQIRELAVYHVK